MLRKLLAAAIFGVFITPPTAASADTTRTAVTAVPSHNSRDEHQDAVDTGGNDTNDDSKKAASQGGSTKDFPRLADVHNGPTTTTLPITMTNCRSDNGIDPNDVYVIYGGQYDICVSNKLTIRDPTPDQADVVAAIKQFYSTTPLPIPTPEISAKNQGICGVVHTLDLHIPASRTYVYPNTDFGSVTIIVHGIPTVDWGDGTKVTYKDTGAPWPNSDIGHSWTTAGKYNIAVTTRWSAEWTVLTNDGQTYGGVLNNLTTTGSIPNFPVIQAQAVIIK